MDGSTTVAPESDRHVNTKKNVFRTQANTEQLSSWMDTKPCSEPEARRQKWKGWDKATCELYLRHKWRVEGAHGEAKTQHGLCCAKGPLERGNSDVFDRHRNESETPGGVLFVFFQEKRPYFGLFWFSRMGFGAISGNFIGCFLQKQQENRTKAICQVLSGYSTAPLSPGFSSGHHPLSTIHHPRGPLGRSPRRQDIFAV